MSVTRDFINEDEEMRAVGHRIIVKLLDMEETIGNEVKFVVAKDDATRRREELGQQIGIIVSMGPSAFDGMAIKDAGIKEGDKVIFKRYDGVHIETVDEDYRFINDDDIYGKIAKKEVTKDE